MAPGCFPGKKVPRKRGIEVEVGRNGKSGRANDERGSGESQAAAAAAEVLNLGGYHWS